MNEKSLKVLEQYDIQVTGTKRGRGSYICETNMGKKLLADYTGSEKKLVFVNEVLEMLKGKGYLFADVILPTKEGNLTTRDRDENVYILKDWYEGRECDTRNMNDVEQAVINLAHLHNMLVLEKKEENRIRPKLLEEDELRRHNRELRKICSFVRKRHQKNEFEVLFLKYYDMFYEQALGAEQWLEGSACVDLKKESVEKGCLCHGNYNQHNIYFPGRGKVFTANFYKCRYDVQMLDLYQFLRKIMEKQNWETASGHRMLELYDREKPISDREMEYLYARLFYPEKFWKLANQYYNRSKSWIPWKNVGKLELLASQQEKRNAFLKSLLR